MDDLGVIIATLLGPLFAVQASQFLERQRQKRAERLQIFKTLMATRAANLDQRHVEALNQIDVVFHSDSKSDKAIRQSWKGYLDHLNDKNYPKETWGIRRLDLMIDLLHLMASGLGYDFDKTHIKNQVYYPEGFGDVVTDQNAIRKSLADILSAKRPLPIWVTNYPGEHPETSEEKLSQKEE